MSTRETALSIFNRLSESQLEAFIVLFNGVYSKPQEAKKTGADDVNEEKAAAFERMEQVKRKIAPFPADFDEKASYLSYLDERYGI